MFYVLVCYNFQEAVFQLCQSVKLWQSVVTFHSSLFTSTSPFSLSGNTLAYTTWLTLFTGL